jgi:hypothetical protein
MFMIHVQLMLKSIHFMTTLVIVLHVTIVARANIFICNYIMRNPNFNCKWVKMQQKELGAPR